MDCSLGVEMTPADSIADDIDLLDAIIGNLAKRRAQGKKADETYKNRQS